MQPARRTAKHFETSGIVAIWVVVASLTMSVRADSFPTFSDLFTQVTNDIALIEQTFDNSPAQKQTLATLVRARTDILDPALPEEQVLSTVVNRLGNDTNYAATLDVSAINARATALARYDALAVRVGDLPPSSRATSAQNLLDDLAPERDALVAAQHASDISELLTPFCGRLDSLADMVSRAQTMTRPRVGKNAVRVMIGRDRFKGGGDSRNSPNIFEVISPSDDYLAVNCRVVDRDEVIEFSLPIITDQVRYEVAQGLATLSYNPAVFGTNDPIAATNGTFFVQVVEKEIYGIFSCEGPGFKMEDGRFRIELPRGLRE